MATTKRKKQTKTEVVDPEPLSLMQWLEVQFDSLDTAAQDHLIMLAARSSFTSRTQLTKKINSSGLRNKKGNQYTSTESKKSLLKLEERELAHSEIHGWFALHQNLLLGIAHTREDFRPRFAKILEHLLRQPAYYANSDSIRARAAYYLGDDSILLEIISTQQHYYSEPVSFNFVFSPFNIELFEQKSEVIRNEALFDFLDYCMNSTTNPNIILENWLDTPINDQRLFRLLGEMAVLSGNESDMDKYTEAYQKWASKFPANSPEAVSAFADPLGWVASLAFMSGNDQQALALFEQSINALRGKSRKLKFVPRGTNGLFYQLALLKRNQPGDCEKVIKLSDWADDLSETSRAPLLRYVSDIASCIMGKGKHLAKEISNHNDTFMNHGDLSIYTMMYVLMARMATDDKPLLKQWSAKMNELADIASEDGFHWLAREAKALSNELKGKCSSSDKKALDNLTEAIPLRKICSPLAELFTPPETWEADLSAIEAISIKYGNSTSTTKKGAKKKTTARKEVIWVLDYCDDSEYHCLDIQPVQRSVSAKGKPTKGRNIAIKTLYNSPENVAGLTEHDFKIAKTIKKVSEWSYEDYEFRGTRTIEAMIGHPLLFALDGPHDNEVRTPIKIKSGRFQIDASESKKNEVKVSLKPAFNPTDRWGMLIRDNPTEFTLYQITPEISELDDVLGTENQLVLPEKAKARFFNAVTQLAEKVDIAADGDLASACADESAGLTDSLKDVDSDSRPRLRLFPDGEGIMVQLVVQPIEQCEHRFAPGEGRESIFGIVDNKRIRAQRQLKKEAKHANWLIENTPALATKRGEIADLWTWQFPTPTEALELLRELFDLPEDCEKNPYIVEWPEDQPFKLNGVISALDFKGSLGGASEWLTISGDVKINDEMVLSMRELLEAADAGSNSGFLELKKGEFIALTEAFSRQLEDIRSLAQPGKSEQIKLPPLAALALEDFVEQSGSKKPGKAWKQWLDRIKEAQDHHPDTPENLQAEFRPYQLDGYRWLSRLAKSGAGACLADDMGLGKTIQTLGLLLERAEAGPALVIAPTSVAANWMDEALKFAPTLNRISFGQGDRKKQLAKLKPFDLVICTYGLLQREDEALAEVEWNTVVLDEAQAIKNSTTKRSKAARSLQADFRVVTTGTPVENRLSELHTLFQFILPGYLGSPDKFRNTFSDPIEKNQDQEARDRLRRLIQPFMLRRLKSSVLKDLPARTEVSIHVELEKEEAAFYEALRQKAVDDIEKDTENPGQKAFLILAQLTKLRRACCHPVLVDKKSGGKIGSSKLAAFSETVSDILSGNHKVLIFSQFVDHLKLIRAELDKKNISYQYLDGSTSKPKRKAAVDAFQRGESDAFLISLKAGGFGLNLTAADYVIHMDPWWNPAAEDQASDRAHRIGQTRPVTIYRFITKDTIEEKIVALHHKKRELAESLLSGTDVADSKLSPEQLMKLLKESS